MSKIHSIVPIATTWYSSIFGNGECDLCGKKIEQEFGVVTYKLYEHSYEKSVKLCESCARKHLSNFLVLQEL